MLCESIPGCILQLYALLKVKNVSSATVVSVLVSALTTGLASKNLSWNFDVDPVARNRDPEFYGFIPNDSTKRTILKVCMVLNSALLLLVRSFSAAMLMLAEKRYFFIYWVGDMALYFLLKAARGDFHTEMPVDGVFGLLASLVTRFMEKTLVDFTGVIQLRHPVTLGGVYWSVNMSTALVVSFVSVWLGGGGVKEWLLVGTTSAAWVATFGVILYTMKEEFRGTFVSTMLGKDMIMRYFKEGEDDATKIIVFAANKRMWVTIYPQVKEFVLANWMRWAEEKPDFFTANFVAKVPLDMIPAAGQNKAKQIRESVRKSSILSARVSPDQEQNQENEQEQKNGAIAANEDTEVAEAGDEESDAVVTVEA